MSRFIRAPKSKAGKITAGITGFILAMGGGALAAFLFTTHAPVSGDVTSSAFTAEWTAASVTGHDGMDCTAALAGTKANVHVLSAFPGGTCDITGNVKLGSGASEGGEITGLDLTLPTGWTATLTSGCGATVNSVGTATVNFHITMGQNAAVGSASTFGTDDGVQISPSSENPTLNCTP